MDWTIIILVVVLILLGLVGWGCAVLAAYCRVRLHNERLARIVEAAGRCAGRISDALRMQPPGANLVALRSAAVAEAVAALRTEFAQSAAKVGATDDKLAGIVLGELGRLPGPAAEAGVPLTAATLDAIRTALLRGDAGVAFVPAPPPVGASA